MSSSSPSSPRKSGNLQDDIDIFFKPIPKRVKLEGPAASYRLAREPHDQTPDVQVALEGTPIVIPDSPARVASTRVQGSSAGTHSEPADLPFVLPADPSELPIYQVRSPAEGDIVLGWVCSQVTLFVPHCISRWLAWVGTNQRLCFLGSCLA